MTYELTHLDALGFDEFGVPLVFFESFDVLVEHGNRESGEDILAAVCGALTG